MYHFYAFDLRFVDFYIIFFSFGGKSQFIEGVGGGLPLFLKGGKLYVFYNNTKFVVLMAFVCLPLHRLLSVSSSHSTMHLFA